MRCWMMHVHLIICLWRVLESFSYAEKHSMGIFSNNPAVGLKKLFCVIVQCLCTQQFFTLFFYKFIIFFIAATHGVYDRPIITPEADFLVKLATHDGVGGVAAWNTLNSANWTIRWFIKILSKRRDSKAVHNRFSPNFGTKASSRNRWKPQL